MEQRSSSQTTAQRSSDGNDTTAADLDKPINRQIRQYVRNKKYIQYLLVLFIITGAVYVAQALLTENKGRHYAALPEGVQLDTLLASAGDGTRLAIAVRSGTAQTLYESKDSGRSFSFLDSLPLTDDPVFKLVYRPGTTTLVALGERAIHFYKEGVKDIISLGGLQKLNSSFYNRGLAFLNDSAYVWGNQPYALSFSLEDLGVVKIHTISEGYYLRLVAFKNNPFTIKAVGHRNTFFNDEEVMLEGGSFEGLQLAREGSVINSMNTTDSASVTSMPDSGTKK